MIENSVRARVDAAADALRDAGAVVEPVIVFVQLAARRAPRTLPAAPGPDADTEPGQEP